jgi:hypothetical protein
MTREEFIEILKDKRYPYRIDGDTIEIISVEDVELPVTSIPPGVKFNNWEDVYLDSLISIPSGVEFNNGGYVYLKEATSISPDVKFNNQHLFLRSIKRIPEDMKFIVTGAVDMPSLEIIPKGVEFTKSVTNVEINEVTKIHPTVVFNNEKYIFAHSLCGSWIHHGKAFLLDSIGPKRIFNLMIKKGMFI